MGDRQTLIDLISVRRWPAWAPDVGVRESGWAMEGGRRAGNAGGKDEFESAGSGASRYIRDGRKPKSWKYVLGAEHPDTLTGMNNAAHTLKGQGKQTEALALVGKYTRIHLRVLGDEHPHTHSSLASLNSRQSDQL